MKQNKNKISSGYLLIFSACLLFNGVQAQRTNEVPASLRQHWDIMAQGTWIADNPKRSDEFPIDAYGMRWEIAPGGMVFTGTLFMIQKGKEDKVLWNFLNYWHPGEQQVISVQYGDNPAFGSIVLGANPVDDSTEESESSSDIYDAAGNKVGSIGHIGKIVGDEFYSNSFDIVEGEWLERGKFVWKLQKD